jgi:hypothetical protein
MTDGERAFPPEIERVIAETVAAMRRALADFPEIEQQREILRRLELWLAMIEASMLPELEARQ